MNTTTVLMVALVMCAGAAHAAAEGPSISVTNHQKGSTRRVEIVIQDPVAARPADEAAPAELPEAGPITAPDGGAITGSLITGGKAYAVTEKKLLTVGEKVKGLTITQVTLDRVTLSRGAHTYELDVESGDWSMAATGFATE